jgi:hypothetical protein
MSAPNILWLVQVFGNQDEAVFWLLTSQLKDFHLETRVNVVLQYLG